MRAVWHAISISLCVNYNFNNKNLKKVVDTGVQTLYTLNVQTVQHLRATEHLPGSEEHNANFRPRNQAP